MQNHGRHRHWQIAISVIAMALATGSIRGEDPGNERSPEQIRTEVESLRKSDVAWREINWKTCLLDGLQESRRLNKPLMLWIFIDRPIDDERC